MMNPKCNSARHLPRIYEATEAQIRDRTFRTIQDKFLSVFPGRTTRGLLGHSHFPKQDNAEFRGQLSCLITAACVYGLSEKPLPPPLMAPNMYKFFSFSLALLISPPE
jgi:hypothetical protein